MLPHSKKKKSEQLRFNRPAKHDAILQVLLKCNHEPTIITIHELFQKAPVEVHWAIDWILEQAGQSSGTMPNNKTLSGKK